MLVINGGKCQPLHPSHDSVTFMMEHSSINECLNNSFSSIRKLNSQNAFLTLSLTMLVAMDHTMFEWAHVCGILRRDDRYLLMHFNLYLIVGSLQA